MESKNLYGAIIGDVVGSRFEGRGKAIKSKAFNFFGRGCHFTDDTVMTVAIAEALLTSGASYDEKSIKLDFVKSLKRWGRKYPNAGYGRRFSRWLESDTAESYGSFGNGAAMRVSPVAHFYDDLETVRRVARWSAAVTHNHRESVKSAEAVATAIFLARSKTSKAEIKSCVEENFGYNLSRTLDEIRPTYRHETAAAQSVPEAIIAFLESEDFEDAIRNAVSLGGDSDTQAAIAGSIAGAFYGVPDLMTEQVNEKIPDEMKNIIGEFNHVLTLQVGYSESLRSVEFDRALKNFRREASQENRAALAKKIRGSEEDGSFFILPLQNPDSQSALISYGLPPFRDMNSFFLQSKRNGGEFLVALTDFRELANLRRHFGFDAYFRMIDRKELLQEFIANGKEICEGIVIDPGRPEQLILTAEHVEEILCIDKSANKSAAYKNLVTCAKARYREYNPDIVPTADDIKKVSDFAATFSTREKFWSDLQYRCAKWEISTDADINDARARESLALAVANGYDLKDPIALFAPAVNGINICDEINLYTYRQGFGYEKNTPKIKYLLVAQDWGNILRADDEFILTVERMNSGEEISLPVSDTATSRNLIKLFRILGRNVRNPCADVFFTNFCLGYRIGNEGGGMTKKLMMRDADLFRELCEILEPENILCLGRITSECVYKALTGESFKRIFDDAEDYNEFLDNRGKFILHYGKNFELRTRYYPLAHCGGMGTRNRSFAKQIDDWKRILL